MGNSQKALYIKEIKIKFFRSIYDITIKDIKSITAITGPNDSGKSNILRALNLFFNDEIEPGVKLDFWRDFNFVRNAETRAQKSSKERRFINVTVIFNPPTSSKLDCKTIKISRWWYENQEKTEYYLDTRRAKGTGERSAISKLLKKTIFEYVPAQRSKYYWKYLFDRFRESFFGPKNKETKNYIDKLNTQISDITKEFEKTFKELTGVPTRLELPQDLSSLFQSMRVLTGSRTSETLELRGDGIQNTYLATLLNYISERENEQGKRVIWGFEEPENSLESNLASKLADEFINTYQNNAQIFLTTHSIPFIARHRKGLNVIRVEWKDEKKGTAIDEADDIIQIMECVDEKFANLMKEKKEKEEELEEIRRNDKRGIIIVEGKNDMEVFIYLWNVLHPDRKQEINDHSTELFHFIECSGNTGDSKKENTGSKKRLEYAKLISKEYEKKVLVIEDRDDEDNNGKIDKPRLKRRRLSLRNLDTYFIDINLLSVAFGVEKEKLKEKIEEAMPWLNVDILNLQTVKKIPESFKYIDGKRIIKELNEKLERENGNWVSVYDIVKHIKDPSEIDDELKEIVQCMEWVINDS